MKLHLPVTLLRAVMALFATTTTFTSAWAQDAAPSDVTYSIDSDVTYGSGEGKTPWEGQESTDNLSNVGNVTFTSNSEKTYSVTFDGANGAFDGEKNAGYTAIVGNVVAFENLKGITFTGFEGASYAVHTEVLTLQNNYNVSIVDNYKTVKRVIGESRINQSNIFAGSVTLSGNDEIIMSRNEVESGVYLGNGEELEYGVALRGGVIYNSSSLSGADTPEVVSVCGNGYVEFAENKLVSVGWEAYGAAVYSEGRVVLENNTKVVFAGNSVDSSYGDNEDWSSRNPYHSEALGGAIFSWFSPSEGDEAKAGVSFVGNGEVEFSKNSAVAVMDASGGAIHNDSSETQLSGNGSLTFRDNKVESLQDEYPKGGSVVIAEGGAIYSAKKLSITGNVNILFDGNTVSSVGAIARGSAIAVGHDILDSDGGVFIDGNTGTITLSNNGVSTYGKYYGKDGNCYSGSSMAAGAVLSLSSLSMSGNDGEITFSGNYIKDLAGTPDVPFDFNGNASKEQSGLAAGAAIVAIGPIAFIENKSAIIFNSNTIDAECKSVFGGAMVNVMGNITFNLNEGNIAFINNSASTTAQGYAWGGAVSTCGSLASILSPGAVAESSVVFDGNKDISFSGNSVSAQSGMANGGAIYSSNDVTLVNNGDISFGGGIQEEDAVVAQEQEPAQNAAGNTAQGYYANGGAIYSEGDVTLGYVDEDGTDYGNGSVEFVGNSAVSSDAHASGGAIFAGGNVTVSGNDGLVKFNENKAQSGGASVEGGAITSATGNVNITDNKAGVEVKNNSVEGLYNAMGAVYAANSINIQDNGNVTIEGNSATEKANVDDTFTAASGGGLNAGQVLNVSGNEDVVVKDNSVSSANGYAIAGGVGAMVVYLDGNKSLTFETNTAAGSQYAGGGAILSTGILAISGQKGDVSFIGNNATSLSGVARGGAITADLTPGADAIWSRIEDWQKENSGEAVPESLFDDMPEKLQPLLAECNSPEEVKAVLSTVVPNSVAIAGNSSVSFTNNSAVSGELNENGAVVSRGDDASGGAIYSNGDVILSANESLKFGGVDGDSNSLGNAALSYGGCANGGAIAAEGDVTIGRYGEGDDMLPGNGSVEFSNNSATSYGDEAKGGAIYAKSDVTLSDNMSGVIFEGNSASSSVGIAQGGAIYTQGNVTMSGNSLVQFNKNSAISSGPRGPVASGGAIKASGNVNISGSMAFDTNSVNSQKSDASYTYGGAIHAEGSINMVAGAKTDTVEFTGNTVHSVYNGMGGAISAAKNSANEVYYKDNEGNQRPLMEFGHDITVSGYGSVTFSENIIDAGTRSRGGAIYADGHISLKNNGGLNFTGNQITSHFDGSALGGAISTYLVRGSESSADVNASVPVSVTISENTGDIVFTNNTATGKVYSVNGGAIFSSNTVTIDKNVGDILFSGNKSTAEIMSESSGGAICSAMGLSISGNTGNITFQANEARSGGSDAFGGALSSQYDDVTIDYNVGNVEFTGNKVYGIGSYSVYDSVKNDEGMLPDGTTTSVHNDAALGGGAIGSLASVNITRNGAVKFSGNETIDSDLETPVDLEVYKESTESCSGLSLTAGGAIMAMGDININGNESVTIDGNKAKSDSRKVTGGALASTARISISDNAGDVNITHNGVETKTGTAMGGAIVAQGGLSIVNNGNVTFSGNYTKNGDMYQLNSVIVESGDVELAAAAGRSISFYDSILVGAGNDVKLNSYTDAEGNTQTSTGAIVFSGANVVETLQQLKGEGNVSDSEISASLTSQIYRNVSVEAGSLQVKDGAVLYMERLGVMSGAELLIGAGSTVGVGSTVTFESGSKFTVIKGLEAAATMSVAETASSTPAAAQIAGNVALAAGMTYTMDGAYANLLGDNNTLTLDSAGGYTFNVDESLASTKGNTKYFVLFTGVETLAGVDPSALTDIKFTIGGNDGYYTDLMLNYIKGTEEYGGVLYISATVPEPTTATLSLLALATLAARRRRR